MIQNILPSNSNTSYLLRSIVSGLNNFGTTKESVPCVLLGVVYHFIGRRNRRFRDRNRFSG